MGTKPIFALKLTSLFNVFMLLKIIIYGTSFNYYILMIRQAIIPLAGLGTRLLPLTSVYAKELLPINGKVGLEYIIDECIDAGVKEIIFIISKKKEIIKKYFYNDKFYKKIIRKKKILELLENIIKLKNIKN